MAFKIENKIIDIDSSESINFSEFLNNVFEKFKKSSPELFKDIDKVKFGIFSNEHGLNATANPKYNPPVIGFTKDLLCSVDSADEMSAILAHELSHLIFRAEKRKTSKRISDINEERFCDVIAFKILEDSGLNPHAFTDFFKKIALNQNPNDRNILDTSYSKDHPNTLERIRNIEDLLAFSEISGKKYNEKSLINEKQKQIWSNAPSFKDANLPSYSKIFASEQVNLENEKLFTIPSSDNEKKENIIQDSSSLIKNLDFSLLENGNISDFIQEYISDFKFISNNNNGWKELTTSFHRNLKQKYDENPNLYGNIIRKLYLDENFKDFGKSFKNHLFLNELLKYKDLFLPEERENLLFKTNILYKISEIDYNNISTVKNFFEFAGITINDYQNLSDKFPESLRKKNINHLNTMLLSVSIYDDKSFNFLKTVLAMQENDDKRMVSPSPFIEYLKKNYQKMLEEVSLDELTKTYIALHNLKINSPNKEVSVNLFDYNQSACKAFEKSIVQKLRTEKNIERISEISGSILKEANLSSPLFRRTLRLKFVSSTFAKIRNDNGSKEFSENFIKISTDILENFKMGEGIKTLSSLARRCALQKETAFMVKKQVNSHLLLNDGINNLPLTKTVTFILDNIEKNKDNQIAVLDFLTSPLNKNNLDESFNKIYPSFEYHTKSPFMGKLPGLFDANNDKEMFKSKMISTHANFWILPKHARTLLLSRIIFPVNDLHKDADTKDFLSDKIFDDKGLLQKNIKELFNEYEKQCSPHLQRLVFSGIVASVSPYDNKNQGKALSEVFSHNGPAGIKVLQALGSYDKSLPDIRKEANKAKSDINLPHIWEIWQDISDKLPKDTHNNLKFKQILGAGAYAYTVEMIDDKGKSYALSLLRNNAKNHAMSEFNRISSAMSELAKNNPYFKELYPLVDDAKQSVLQECDLTISAKKANIAGKNYYTGQTYQIDGFNFTVKNAEIFDSSKEYKLAEKAKGNHLNDMPPSQDYTKAAAKAVFTTELEQILKGVAIDSDRHGAQMKVDNDGNITMFDNSALKLDDATLNLRNPSEEQIKTVAKLVKKAVINSVINKTDMQLSLIKELSSLSYDKDTTDYITTMKRALLALKDSKMLMGESQEERNLAFKNCVINALNAKTTHPIIKKEFMALKAVHKVNEGIKKITPPFLKKVR